MRKKFIVFFGFIFLFFSVNVFAQDGERVINKLKVTNNKVVSEQTILSKLKSKEGSEYSPLILSDDIKRLYATGLFNDVSADLVDEADGLTVVFKVEEKPMLKEIVFTGNRRVRTKKLKVEMTVKTGEIFDQFQLKEDIVNLKKLYAKKGYSLAELDYSFEEKEHSVIVTITVKEGKRIRIRKISFEGNGYFDDARLRKIIKTKKRGWFNSGFFKEDVWAEDTDRLNNFYRMDGFIDALIEPTIEYNQKNDSMYITFKISEGKQYRAGNVLFKGNQVFLDSDLTANLELLNDQIYSENKLRSDISKIQAHYFDAGYIASSVKADTILNPETGQVDVSYNISEGKIGYLDKVNIKGNVRTKDIVIRREMRLFPGDRYNGEKLRRSRQRLYNLGYFEEVSFNTDEQPSTLPDKYDMDVFVKESKTGEFSFGAGYSSVDKFIGFVDLTQRNFDIFNFPTFTGAGQKLRLRMEFGSEKKDYELSFVEPWFLGYPLATGFNVYSRTQEWDKYDEKRIGGNLFASKELGEYWQNKWTYRYESIRIDDIQDDASNAIKAEAGKNYISSIRTDIIHDTRDNLYNPRTGVYNQFSTEYAGGCFGGDKDFVKYETKNNKYFPMGHDDVLDFQIRVGMIEAFSDSVDVPVYERFYAGGANTIRGYKERRVGPEGEQGDPIGGRLRAIFNAEYTHKLTNNLKWAFFYDIGNVWSNNQEFIWDNLKLKAAIGTGIRVKTPLGPIRLDYGYALNPKEGDAKGRFHFAMSHEF
ncbi:MAG: outer membrane protein assembly factor BamA [Candidatus Omnitrophica bacterium]|nr:outer membrane protein assembly factor BamA [Candidatus Omnitrophota bacterium]